MKYATDTIIDLPREKVISLFDAGIVKGDKIVSHTFPLDRIAEAFDTFVNRKDGAIKVVIEP